MRKIFSPKSGKTARQGFTLIELLVTIGIIAVLAGAVFIIVSPMVLKARDAQRKAEISDFGRVLLISCYTPTGGPGTYDLGQIYPELLEKYPQLSGLIDSQIPHDPSGNNSTTLYMYSVTSDKKCALYANLENGGEFVTLPGLSQPTPGGGTGVLNTAENGWNGSSKYFQVAK